MTKSIKKILARAFFLLTIPFITITSAHAGTLGSATSTTGSWGWSFSYENMQFTRANITLDDGTIIAAPTFDITENSDFVTGNGVTTGTGSALFKGILKVTHGPAPDLGEAWAEVQIKWPVVDITITSEEVSATNLSTGNTFTYLKESRVYKVTLSDSASNEGKLTDGYKRIVPGLPRSGVYDKCDGTDHSFLCDQAIGYGADTFDPNVIFHEITTASGATLLANTGFYMDEYCVAFKPDDLGANLSNGQDFNLKEDADGYFRTCEGRSVAFNACTDPEVDANGDPVLDGSTTVPLSCNQTNTVTGTHFTLILADAAAGDRLKPAPTTACIGTSVTDWLALSAYSGTGDDLVITPCDPNQGYMLLPYVFSDSQIEFTSSEGDNAVITDLQITSITTRDELNTSIFLEENPDKTNSVWDFSKIAMKNISSIAGIELDDTITGTAGTDVILGGNGNDSLYGYEGDDCIDGGQNDDHMWGDGTADVPSAGARGADVFVLTSKQGKDTIYDFEVGVDKFMNVSGTTPVIADNGDGTYSVTLKGQNYVTVYATGGVLDSSSITDGLTGVCSGHSLNN